MQVRYLKLGRVIVKNFTSIISKSVPLESSLREITHCTWHCCGHVTRYQILPTKYSSDLNLGLLSQPRPQVFSLKNWVGPPSHFLREKPRGRGCYLVSLAIEKYFLIAYDLIFFSLSNCNRVHSFSCRCDRRKIPLVTDLEYDAFITDHVPRTQLLVVSVTSSL